MKVDSRTANTASTQKAKILIIDDHRFSRMTMIDILSLDGYEVLEADNSAAVLDLVYDSHPDLILLDVMMPQMNGFEVCRRLKQDERTRQIPVIFVTVTDDRRLRLKCIEAGGEDCLVKPLDRLALSARVKSLIHQKRLNENLDQTEQVLFSIAKAIKNRYPDGNNSEELAALSRAFGCYVRLSPEDIQKLRYATYLHDIGTVGIPDAVLLKEGKLTPEEREMIDQHVLLGEELCQPLRHRCDVLPIIRHHHERWDGSGHPDGLVGDEIPYLAQVFQILDIYMALTSNRPYKQALTSNQALAVIEEEAARGWRNPRLTEQFVAFIQAQETLKSSL
ncbi:MAG: two-component system response regulator [Cyanophyceae cyanobacterium]